MGHRKTTQEKAIGERVAEAAATKMYERYGDRIPVSLNPEQVADLAYETIKRRQEHGKKSHRVRDAVFGLLKVMLGVAAGICLIGAITTMTSEGAKHHHHTR